MITIKDKKDCCGCTACYNICPKNAIKMCEDEEGFLYPVIDNKKCIKCGLCVKTCPEQKYEKKSDMLEAFALQHKEQEILYHSAAGGAFSAIASYVIEKDGIVFGAAYNEDMCVSHCESDKELGIFRSSKYVQSVQGESYKAAKLYLEEGRWVCYSGTPCQIVGLKKYLGKDYERLITVDVVCKGVGSPEVFRQYKLILEKKYNSRIIGMNFKRKTYGYHSSTMSVDFENGKTYSKGGITDLMMRSFRANICLRPSCSDCSFKGADRVSDFTIFDCWHYEELTQKKDNDKGQTAVLVHTTKGKDVLEWCSSFVNLQQIDVAKVIELDGVMVNGVVNEHAKREEYMNVLKNEGLEKAVNQVIPIHLSERVKDGSKQVLYRLGLLSIMKKIFSNRNIK